MGLPALVNATEQDTLLRERAYRAQLVSLPSPPRRRKRAHLDDVLGLLELGLHIEEVAFNLGVHRSTLYRMKAKHPEAFAQAEAKGREAVLAVCYSTLIVIALNPASKARDQLKACEALLKATGSGGYGPRPKVVYAPEWSPMEAVR